MSMLRRMLIMMHKDYQILHFKDAEVKRICVENFGGENGISNGVFGQKGIAGYAGEVTYKQAAAVVASVNLFLNNQHIITTEDLTWFVHLSEMRFSGCENLHTVVFPPAVDFYGWQGLPLVCKVKTLIIPKQIRTVQYQPFCNNSVERLVLEGRVNIMYGQTFGAQLQAIYVRDEDRDYYASQSSISAYVGKLKSINEFKK